MVLSVWLCCVSKRWEKQSLSKLGKTLSVDNDQSVLDIEIFCSDYISGIVKIAGMALQKKHLTPLLSSDVKY